MLTEEHMLALNTDSITQNKPNTALYNKRYKTNLSDAKRTEIKIKQIEYNKKYTSNLSEERREEIRVQNNLRAKRYREKQKEMKRTTTNQQQHCKFRWKKIEQEWDDANPCM